MTKQVTLSLRSLAGTAVVVSAVVSAYLVGTQGRGPTAEAAVGPQPSSVDSGGPRTIRMSGTGAVTGVPDQLAFHLTITRTAPDVSTAMDRASAVMTKVLTALGGAGVDRKDTQSTGLSVDPVFHYSSSAPPVITGYRVRQSADVLVRDISASGRAISTAAHTGGDAVRVSGIRLRIGDVEALLARARREAVRAATAKAEEYAQATHQQLGDVLTLRETHGRGVRAAMPKVFDAVRAVDGGIPVVPVRAGRQQLKVMVGIVWQFR